MARTRVNTALTALRGKLDGYVYKTFKHGGGCVSRLPNFKNFVPSAGTRAGNERWRLATAYASAVWKDPQRRAFYEQLAKEKRAWRAYNLATGDFMNPPKIGDVRWDNYDGQAGDWIRIDAWDDVGVIGIRVEIRDVNGRIWEYGLAGDDPNGRWRYTATETLPTGVQFDIEIGADDRPGNRTIQRHRWQRAG